MNFLEKLVFRQFLKGKKTYLVALGFALNLFLLKAGFVDQATFDAVNVALAGGGLATLRAGMNK